MLDQTFAPDHILTCLEIHLFSYVARLGITRYGTFESLRWITSYTIIINFFTNYLEAISVNDTRILVPSDPDDQNCMYMTVYLDAYQIPLYGI